MHSFGHASNVAGGDDHKVPTPLREQNCRWNEGGSEQFCHVGDVLGREMRALCLFPTGFLPPIDFHDKSNL